VPNLYRAILTTAIVIALLIAPLSAQHKAIDFPSANEPDPAFIQVPEDPSLPRVLIMGDSISLGYTWEVRKLLAGKANVQHPDVNCWSTTFALEHIRQWIGKKRWDVIYFNFGLHDLKYLNDQGEYVTPEKGKQVSSIQQYQANLRSIVTTLRRSGAKLIFATTTPVPSGANGRVQGDEIRYNAAATEVMQESGIEIDDLWNVVNPSLTTLQQPHNVHFTAEGSRVLGAEVASRIAGALPVASKVGTLPKHVVIDTSDAALIFKEFDGKTPNGVWDRQGPPQPPDFKYAVKPGALEMYSNTPLNQHLVREGVAIDPLRAYAVEGKFLIPALGDDANSFCVNLNVAGPDGDVSNVNTWSLNVDLHQEGGAVIKFMGFVNGRFTEIGQLETTWGAAKTEYAFRMYVNADYDGRYQSKRVSMFVRQGSTQLEKLMVDYSSFPYQPDPAKPVRLGVNTHNTDWVLRDLKVYYLDVPQQP
jgi:GDSL-like Lipase/Acylhydrolase family